MKKKLNIAALLIPLAVVALNLLIVIFPKETVGAAKDGISLWFNNVFPSLLPFIIGSNILSALGVVDFAGVLLEPVMAPVFGVSGSGGYALAVGLMSGYPMGGKVVSELRQRNEISKIEGQRLLSFVNNSGPLFVIGAVASGMFRNAYAGYYMLIIHYLGAICTGLLFRLYKRNKNLPERPPKPYSAGLLQAAYRKMAASRKKDGRPIGLLLGQCVADAMETILQIGGFIILFCVITKALDIVGFFQLITSLLRPATELIGIPQNLCEGILVGIIEITNGANILSGAYPTESRLALIAAAAVISFGGFSIHAQTASFISKTDLSTVVYILSKVVNSLLTILFGFLLYPFFRVPLSHSVVAFSPAEYTVPTKLLYSAAYFGVTIAALLVVMLITLVAKINRTNGTNKTNKAKRGRRRYNANSYLKDRIIWRVFRKRTPR